MILILTASIMYWSLLQKAKVNEDDRPPDEPTVATEEVEGNPAMDEAATDDGGAGTTDKEETVTEEGNS